MVKSVKTKNAQPSRIGSLKRPALVDACVEAVEKVLMIPTIVQTKLQNLCSKRDM